MQEGVTVSNMFIFPYFMALEKIWNAAFLFNVYVKENNIFGD